MKWEEKEKSLCILFLTQTIGRFLPSFKITNPITDSENLAMILLLLMMMNSGQPSSDGQWSSCEVDGAALISA